MKRISSPRRATPLRRDTDESGFSLIELLVVMVLSSILMTLGAFAIRHFWFVRSLEGGTDGVVSQLRSIQQSAVAESNPVVHGAAFVEGTPDWALVRYLPAAGPPPAPQATCTVTGTRRLDARVIFSSAQFSGTPAGLDVADAFAVCSLDPLVAGATENDFVFFLARGTARPGTVTLLQQNLGRSRTVTVAGLTARVSRQ